MFKKLSVAAMLLVGLAICATPAIAANRVMVYSGQNPSSTETNQQPRFQRLADGTFMRDVMGSLATTGAYSNLSIVSGSGLCVTVNPTNASQLGALYQLAADDPNPLPPSVTPNLPADNTNIVIQATQATNSSAICSLNGATTPGQSRPYLLEAQLTTIDGNQQSMLFVSSNGTTSYQNVNTYRSDTIVYQTKTGSDGVSPTPPPVDSGWVSVGSIIVPQGTSQITSGMIAMTTSTNFQNSIQGSLAATAPINLSTTGGVTTVSINGLTSLTASKCIRAASTTALGEAAGDCVTNVTASGNIASSGGTTPNITFTGTLPTGSGGTGQTTYTSGDCVRAATASQLASAAGDCVTSVTASGNLASSGGTTPAITMTSTPTFSSITNSALSGAGQSVVCATNAGVTEPCEGAGAVNNFPDGGIAILVNSVDGCHTYTPCNTMSGACASGSDCGSVTFNSAGDSFCFMSFLADYTVPFGVGLTTPTTSSGWLTSYSKNSSNGNANWHVFNFTGSSFANTAGDVLAGAYTCLNH